MGFKPTIFVSLLVVIIFQRVQFSRRTKKDLFLVIADGYWLDVSSQFQGLLKEVKAAIGFSTTPQRQWIVDYLLCFSRSISFRSEKPSRVMAALNSHQQRSAIGKNQYIGKSSFSRRWTLYSKKCIVSHSFVQGKSFKVIYARTEPRLLNI